MFKVYIDNSFAFSLDYKSTSELNSKIKEYLKTTSIICANFKNSSDKSKYAYLRDCSDVNISDDGFDYFWPDEFPAGKYKIDIRWE